MTHRLPHLVLALLAACAGDKEPTGDTDSDADTDADSDADTDTDTDADSDTDTDVEPVPAVRDPKFDDLVQVLLDELDLNLAAGASIAVMEAGQITWAEGFGTADPGGQVAIDPAMAFQIGSTTKQMTAAVVLQQVQAGTLALNTPMSDVLPAFSMAVDPTWAPSATLHDLISHQGGLYDTVDWTGSPDDAELATWLYGSYGPYAWPMSPPGAFWNYSNPNFMLAGLAAEEHDAAGRYYADLLIDDLFGPLGMSRTFIRKDDVLTAGNYALSTGIDIATYATVDLAMDDIGDPASVRPAGLVWSTPTDMCTWGNFLIHGDPAVLDDGLRAEITTPQVSTLYDGDHLSYGYGEFVWDLYPLSDGWYPIRVWEHGGNTLSFTSAFYVLPDQDVVFSILSNGYGDLFPATVEGLIRAVVDPLPTVSDYVGEGFDPTRIGVHPGIYRDPYNVGDIIITSDGAGGLLIDIPVLDGFYTIDSALIPGSTDVWYMAIDGTYLDLTFIRDPAGGPSPYVRNRSFVGAREIGPARVAPPTPDRERIRRWLEAAKAPVPIPTVVR